MPSETSMHHPEVRKPTWLCRKDRGLVPSDGGDRSRRDVGKESRAANDSRRRGCQL